MNKHIILKLGILIILILNIFNIKIYAATGSIDDVISGGDSFIESASSSGVKTLDTNKMKESSNIIYNVLL